MEVSSQTIGTINQANSSGIAVNIIKDREALFGEPMFGEPMFREPMFQHRK